MKKVLSRLNFLTPSFSCYLILNRSKRVCFWWKITTIAEGVTRVLQEMKQYFDSTKNKSWWLTFFVAGSSQTDSETKIQVGGLDSVPTTAFEGFDYVALGHLHANTALNHERIRYSGSPLKFSLSEITNEKGVYIVDTQKGPAAFLSVAAEKRSSAIHCFFWNIAWSCLLSASGSRGLLTLHVNGSSRNS